MFDKRILIIDDSEIDREILQNILIWEYMVEAAEDGLQGLDRLLKGSPSIDGILLDLYMPIIDGFGVLKLLQDNGISDIPIVVITEESTSENLYKALPYNIADFICKPYDPDTLLDRLKAAFG
ncbi:MAG: response regulator [Lachnospiraceae bacterium]|nr:response regulator [Lachnospiraceae bacterium]